MRVRGRDFSPPEISALVLGKMRQTAEDWLGEPVTEAVVTVPAYFDDAQRQATKDAGRIAGLNVLRIVNEPTAAALAYGVETEGAQRVAVYDLGGGTFDISILELDDGVFRVRSTAGDTFLGGEDFDNAIVEHLLATFADAATTAWICAAIGWRCSGSRRPPSARRSSCRAAFETEINLPFIAAAPDGPRHLQLMFERARARGARRAARPADARAVPARARPTPAWRRRDIDVVILVGGQTRMPRIQALVAEMFGKEASRRVNPDEVVAVGAAIQAGVLTGEVQEVLLLDVTPLSLGVETAGGVFTRLIPRNTALPARATEIFSTTIDNQPFVNVHVLQGEREMAADNKSLAHFELTGIPPAPRGVPEDRGRVRHRRRRRAQRVGARSRHRPRPARHRDADDRPVRGRHRAARRRVARDGRRRPDPAPARRGAQQGRGPALLVGEGDGRVRRHACPTTSASSSRPSSPSAAPRSTATTSRMVQDAVARLEVSAQRIGEAIYAAAEPHRAGDS